MKRLLFAFALAVLATALPHQARAACVGLGCHCEVSATAVNFGIYDTLLRDRRDGVGEVTVTCGGLLLGLLIDYTISLSTGNSGNYASRRMTSGKHSLSYNLYTNSARTNVWGNGSGGTSTVSDGYLLQLLLTETRRYPIYGRVFSGQNIAAGFYSDTIVVTVSY